MPELPEVETTVKGIKRVAVGKVISDVWTDYNSPYHAGSDNIKDPKYFLDFKKQIIGRKIVDSKRRAKNILIELDNGNIILIHMKMTGHVMYGSYSFDPKKKKDPWESTEKEDHPLKDPFNKFIHLVFTLKDKKEEKQLVLSDMRKFAKVTLISGTDSLHLKDLGPEPLDDAFTFPVMKKQVMKRPSGKIKTVLMDQSLIAGIGNIYSDEVLWRAGVHPEERVQNIPEEKLKIIFKAIKSTLLKGIDFGGDSMSDYRNIDGERGKFQDEHNAYRKTKSRCKKPGCKGIIVRKVVGMRSAHFCDTHQKLLMK